VPPQEFLLVVFCLVDDELKALAPARLRRSGPAPKLADSEVIAVQVVGELWGLADDRAIYRHFRRYHAAEFPALAAVHRTTFARQAANLCWLVRRLQARLAGRLAGPGGGWLIDSAPLPVCRFARARRDRRFRGAAAYGHDPVAAKAFYGFRLHLRTSPDGVILGYELAAANAPEVDVARALAPRPVGVGLGDRGYWSPALRRELRGCGGEFLAPFKKRGSDPDPAGSARLLALRRRIETAFGQLVERLNCRRVRVKDLWHLEHRLVRKIYAHTVAAWLNVRDGHQPLQIDRLVA
jgi:DDE family transposase